jgi:hypothetical protein
MKNSIKSMNYSFIDPKSSFIKKHVVKSFAFLIAVSLIAGSCQKELKLSSAKAEDRSLSNHSNVAGQEKKIYVSNVEELYAAVNDPGNVGAELIMSPGIYLLNAGYPNGGRLELQPDMSLRGQPGNPDAVLIDQSSLPGSSFRLSPTVSVAGIRMGRGTNSLEWLSIKGGSLAANPLSAVEPDLLSTETTIGISHVYLDCNGSRIGVLLRNRLAEHAGRVVNANLEYSEIANAVNAVGSGIALQNRISGAQIKLNMKENYIHGCRIAILNFNSGLDNTVENCTAEISSHTDRIEGNGCGLDLSGGSNSLATTYSNNNTATLKMYGSTITDNNPAGHPELVPVNGALPSGIYAAGGYNGLNNVAAYNRVSGNSLKMGFWGCDISDNNGTDIYAYGAWSPPLAILAGTNNLLEIYLYGLSANATVDATASIPAESAGTNVVNVFRN